MTKKTHGKAGGFLSDTVHNVTQPMFIHHVSALVCTQKKRLWREMHKNQVPETLYSIESLGS